MDPDAGARTARSALCEPRGPQRAFTDWVRKAPEPRAARLGRSPSSVRAGALCAMRGARASTATGVSARIATPKVSLVALRLWSGCYFVTGPAVAEINRKLVRG